MKYLMIFLMFVGQVAFGAANFTPVTLLSACPMATSCTSPGLDLNQLNLASIEAVFSGAPVGTLMLQVSADNVQPCVADPANANCPTFNPGGNVINWVNYTGSSEAVASSGNFLWNLTFVGYRWLRMIYTPTSGTGSLSATFTGKGI